MFQNPGIQVPPAHSLGKHKTDILSDIRFSLLIFRYKLFQYAPALQSLQDYFPQMTVQ